MPLAHCRLSCALKFTAELIDHRVNGSVVRLDENEKEPVEILASERSGIFARSVAAAAVALASRVTAAVKHAPPREACP